jgi:hypothetical protein
MHLELQSGATHMPQQIDVRDHRKCNDHDSLRSSRRGSRRIVTMILRRLCRNVDVSPTSSKPTTYGSAYVRYASPVNRQKRLEIKIAQFRMAL